jgi:uncharacterized membrane protein
LNRSNLNAAQRVGVAAVIGIIGGVIASLFVEWQLALLIAWDIAAAAVVAWHWVHFLQATPEQTEAHAVIEDDTRVGADFAIVVASIASLLGVGYTVHQAGNTDGIAMVGYTIVGVATVAASWFAIHTSFTTRYARLYYTPPIGGIDFKTRDERPDYRDFAYVAFTVGMTWQVSDTDVQHRLIRRLVLRQALISYLFGVVIIAVTINMVANVLQ